MSHPKPATRRVKETRAVVKPAGRFIRSSNIHLSTDRSPEDVTSINPRDMEPILPEMPYLPPA
jgi:hypothetical protein